MPFYFYTIVLGIAIGAVFTWFLVADHPFESLEAPGGPVDGLESGVLASQMRSAGFEVDEAAVTRLLQLHGAYVVGERLDEAGRGEPPAPASDESSPGKDDDEPGTADPAQT
jgi:hypothetical protein